MRPIIEDFSRLQMLAIFVVMVFVILVAHVWLKKPKDGDDDDSSKWGL